MVEAMIVATHSCCKMTIFIPLNVRYDWCSGYLSPGDNDILKIVLPHRKDIRHGMNRVEVLMFGHLMHWHLTYHINHD